VDRFTSRIDSTVARIVRDTKPQWIEGTFTVEGVTLTVPLLDFDGDRLLRWQAFLQEL
jgi:hypothetical protein